MIDIYEAWVAIRLGAKLKYHNVVADDDGRTYYAHQIYIGYPKGQPAVEMVLLDKNRNSVKSALFDELTVEDWLAPDAVVYDLLDKAKKSVSLAIAAACKAETQSTNSRRDEMLNKIYEQIEIECFNDIDRRTATEIARIIRDVMCSDDSITFTVNKIKMRASDLKDIFAQLTHEHIDLVITQERQKTTETRFVVSWRIAALYNAFCGYEGYITNAVGLRSN